LVENLTKLANETFAPHQNGIKRITEMHRSRPAAHARFPSAVSGHSIADDFNVA
jgi:hypothetical protein